MKGIIVSENSTEQKRELVPSGTHVAICYSMIHIGTVEYVYQGETKWSNKVRLTFELPNEMRDFGGEQKPMVISKEYNLSLHEKSNLRKDIETWKGVGLTDKELRSFDITDLIGKECMISIMHKTGASGNEYAAISNVSKMSMGISCPVQFNKSFIFNYTDNFNQEWLEEQPEWIQLQIKGTEEYIAKINQLKLENEF